VKSPTVKFVVTDTHMGLGHSGLNEVIRAHKKQNPLFAKVMNTDGGLILFLNKSRTAAKLYAENGPVIGYLRLPAGKLTERSIEFIPETFGGSLQYASAAKSAFKKFLEVEKESKVGAKTQLQFG
jgi:hypothetical protein